MKLTQLKELLLQSLEHEKGGVMVYETALKEVCAEVEEQEDEHLFHTKGWCRELSLESLGLKTVLPRPEERKQVKTAIGAARAEQSVTSR